MGDAPTEVVQHVNAPAAPGRHQRAGPVHAADPERQLHPGGPRRRAAQRPERTPACSPRSTTGSAARSSSAGNEIAKSVRTERPADLPAPVPAGPAVRAGHRLLLARLRQHRHRAGRERRAVRLRPPAVRPAARRPVHRPRPGRRRRRPDPRPGGAAGRDGTASRASPAPSWRSTPPPARSSALASTPTYDPNPLSSHDPAAIRAVREASWPPASPTRGSTRRSASATRPARCSR